MGSIGQRHAKILKQYFVVIIVSIQRQQRKNPKHIKYQIITLSKDIHVQNAMLYLKNIKIVGNIQKNVATKKMILIIKV